jgi:glycosyltransferase involved in cell wall biosynthesis
MKPLRFAMVTTFYPPHNFGGDGIAVQRLSRALVRRGHHVTVLHDVDAYNLLHQGEEPSPTAEPPGLEVHRLRSRFNGLSPLLNHQLGTPVLHSPRIRRILRHGAFDVIHFHNVSLIGGPGILSAGRGLKVYEAHEHWLVCPTHVLWRHNREPCTGRQCARCLLHYRRPPQLWRYTGMLDRRLRHIDILISKSEFSRQKHGEFGFSGEMEVLPYFLPDMEAHEPVGSSPHHRPYFLFVGRLERIKGLDDVIPLFRRYPEADLLIAGDGTHGPTLQKAAADVPGVRFLGRLSVEELHRHYAHALAVIVPSVGFETFGIIIIEAFRHGTPVIARRIGPFPEIVESCGGGLLFRNVEELGAAMRRLQQDDSLRADLGRRARRGFLENWTEDVIVPRYLKLVRQSIHKAAGRPPRATQVVP